MSLVAQVRAGLQAGGVRLDDRVLVGVSGGLDSTSLLRLLVEIGQPVVAAHVDHQLRADGAEEAAFVAALAARLGVSFEGLAVTVAPGNVQAEARRARYHALAEAAGRHGCRVVATAHTASDQAETVLAALARGAGLRGMAGMPVVRPLLQNIDLVRPLLASARTALRAHAEAAGWTWREDPSNAGRDFHRNRLRADVMPWLRDEHGGGVDLRIAASADAARAALGIVQAHLGALTGGPRRLSIPGLRAVASEQRALLLAEAIAKWAPEAVRSRPVVQRVAALVEAGVGTRVEGGGLRVWRERDVLRFAESSPDELGGVLVATPLDAVPTSFDTSPEVEVVDADRLGAEVAVRGWQEGDRIRPLRLGGSRLVSDLLRERGVPRADRARVPVVLVEGEVAWVVGHRLAAHVAIRPETRRAVEWAWHRTDEAG